MSTEILLLLLPVVVFGYNLDTSRPILYSDPSVSNGKNLQNDSGRDYFGYTVLLYHSAGKNSSWLIVGAPRGNYSLNQRQKLPTDPGVAYRCELFGKKCTQVTPSDPYDIPIQLPNVSPITIHKAGSWFGAALSIYEPDDILTICAPRTTMTIRTSRKKLLTIHGLCYNGLITSGNMKADTERAFDHDFSKGGWNDPVRGFSIKYSTNHSENAIGIEGIPISKGHGAVQLIRLKKSLTKKTNVIYPPKGVGDKGVLPYFGYCVTSGYFFKKNELLFATSAPGLRYTGAIAIINPTNPALVPSIIGNVIGQYFGASLAAGDLNNDGLDDLIVGAPHWGQDNGKVYIYLGSETGEFVAGATLSGNVEGGQFGYALVSGDLDGDGFDDLIVGAPWEDSGVVYVFNGRIAIEEGTLLRSSQRISGSDIFYGLQGFGYTFSKPIDIDGNGYPEVAIGAYKSGHVVVLRGKPVVRTIVTSKIYPSSLNRNSTSFQLETCIDQLSKKIHRVQKYKIEARIDEDLKRIKESELKSLQYLELSKGSCTNYSFSVANDISNFLDPINIFIRYQIAENVEKTVIIIGDKGDQDDTFCHSCAMESSESLLKWIQLTLPFDIGCGDDKVCHSTITANAIFLGVQDNDTWVIGSDDISLEIKLNNHGEIAYLTTVVFSFPDGVTLRSILPSCQEGTSNNSLTVTCDVGNLADAMNKSVLLDLDMKALHESSWHNKTLNFTMTIRTRSINKGISQITMPLRLVTKAALTITGKANEESYYFSRKNENTLNITFQHTYQIIKLGATPISDSELTVDMPIATGNYSYFLSVYEPQLYISGSRYECSSQGIVWFRPDTLDTTLEDDNTDVLQSINVYQRGKRNSQNSSNPVHLEVNTTLMNQTDLSKEEKGEIIYLNCSTHGVQCERIKCNLAALKETKDIGKLYIKMVLHFSTFNATSPHVERIIRLSLNANVTVIRPSISLPIAGTISMINVTTAFYGTATKIKVSFWILVGSLFLGLLLLCIIVGILSWLGFFKRQTKEDLQALKANILNMESISSE
ncbi:integrin alpha-V [Cephus cinctus]|uniref:Integrin alpha-V n=1 Tax=Cephus cinctus TaxID=211228 RepID=A0AAJ7BUY1_CEPCN|nr:integrin alpha-V [Cephus cinctus]